MLFSKNGSIPKPQTDGTEGWFLVPDEPTAPEGKEVVWWFPPGWVIRDPKPSDIEGFVWKWSQTEQKWNSYAIETTPEPVVPSTPSADIVIDSGSADISLTFGTATGI